MDDLLCVLAFLGCRPRWHAEWWTRPPFATVTITPRSSARRR
jgi:hypothetical protein